MQQKETTKGLLKYHEECLETAFLMKPYTRWKKLDPGKDFSMDERYSKIPPLTKYDMRRYLPEDFIRPGISLDAGIKTGEIELVETSGTTGDRVTNIWHQKWWDASERASWRLHAKAQQIPHFPREAILTSPLCTGIKSRNGKPVQLKQRITGRFLYLNEYDDPSTWNPVIMRRMLQELEYFQPVTIDANPSYLAILARYAYQHGIKPYQPVFITLTYENPSLLHYKSIKQVFSAPVASSYGSTETGYVFMECEAGNMHQNTEFCRVDFQPFKNEHGGPNIGRIFVTPLRHAWTILLRFDIGDVVRLQKKPCPCGRRNGLTIEKIEGRMANITITTKGKAVTQGQLDKKVSSLKELHQYKLIQKSLKKYLFFCVHDGPKCRFAKKAMSKLKDLYGHDAQIEIIPTSFISPDPPGKYRLAKCDFGIDTNTFFDTTNTAYEK